MRACCSACIKIFSLMGADFEGGTLQSELNRCLQCGTYSRWRIALSRQNFYLRCGLTGPDWEYDLEWEDDYYSRQGLGPIKIIYHRSQVFGQCMVADWALHGYLINLSLPHNTARVASIELCKTQRQERIRKSKLQNLSVRPAPVRPSADPCNKLRPPAGCPR
jgi:hypothetical protein